MLENQRKHTSPSEPEGMMRSRWYAAICRPSVWLASFVVAVCIAAVYGPHIGVPLIFDDVASILNNKSIRTLWPPVNTKTNPGPLNPPADLPTSGRPLVNVSFAVNY